MSIITQINNERKSHWENVYRTKGPNERSWFQQIPETSLKLIDELNLPKSARIMDNGGGDSLLVDNLLNFGFRNITVQDISETALNIAKERLNGNGERIIWQTVDSADCCPAGQYDLWHDRAAFHFLTDSIEIENYINTLKGCVKPGGHLIIATFSEDGPPKCSGLNVTRYSEKDMTEVFSNDFIKEKCFKEDHITPFGTVQKFLFCVFRKKDVEQERKLNSKEIEKLDPYQFMAELGKKVIHPGGNKSTNEMLELAAITGDMKVLDIGCGVGTTATEIAERYGCTVTAADLDVKMLRKAGENINNSDSKDRIKIISADIQQMPFEDEEFDVVLVEAVTMFVDRRKAVNEIFRVCKKGGKVIEHEFIWRQRSTAEARRIFEGEVCPGIQFDNTDDWLKLYKETGFKTGKFTTGPFAMMSPGGFIKDEGIIGILKLFTKTITRIPYIKKMMWLMPRIMKIRNQLGYVVFEGVKQVKTF